MYSMFSHIIIIIYYIFLRIRINGDLVEPSRDRFFSRSPHQLWSHCWLWTRISNWLRSQVKVCEVSHLLVHILPTADLLLSDVRSLLTDLGVQLRRDLVIILGCWVTWEDQKNLIVFLWRVITLYFTRCQTVAVVEVLRAGGGRDTLLWRMEMLGSVFICLSLVIPTFRGTFSCNSDGVLTTNCLFFSITNHVLEFGEKL